MSEQSRRRATRERWASDHERARHLAAERLALPLPSGEEAWLDRHLRSCPPCASIAADYAAQQSALRSLEEPIPPRDLWARTATALDGADRQARDLPGASVFPGRGGVPGSRGSRSIRGLRAEHRATAFRTSPRAIPPRLMGMPRERRRRSGWAWLAPFGALAAMVLVIIVGGNAILSESVTRLDLGVANASARAAGTLAAAVPGATPIQVGAGEVAWLTPAEDGTYSLNMAAVDRVCPPDAALDCAPMAPASPRRLPTVRTTLHSVLRDPSRRNLVVVTTGTKKASGGSLYVVAVPTEAPRATPATSAEPAASEAATASPVTGGSSAEPGGSAAATPPAASSDASAPAGGESQPAPTADESPIATASAPQPSDSDGPSGPAPTEVLPTATAPSPTAVASGEPQPTATALAIISDIVVVGETAAYSPDGTMLAFSARPADGSAGPDIYLWRVGEAAAQPITSDHGSVFSGWLSNQLLGSRAVDEAGRPTSDGGTAPFATASGAPDSSAEPSASGVPIDPLASASPSGEASPTTGAAGSADPSPSSDGDTGGSSATGIAGTAMTVAFQIVARPAAAAAGGAQPTDPPTGAAPAAAPIGRDGPVPPAASARSFILDPGSGAETSLLGPAWRPVVDPTGRFVAYWAGSLRYDASALSWLPDRGALVLASWPALRGAGPTGALDAIPLLGNGPTDIPAGEWDVRWDETGTHIAIWLADADNPELGRLNLLTVDASGRIDPRGIALHDAPALPGFSIGNGRLAWATTPGQDGEGSRLQVLAWSGANAGKIDSQPVSGDSAVVVVR